MSVPEQPSYRQRVGYHAGLLGLFALLASAALVNSYIATKDDIALRLDEDLKATLGKVIPASLHDNDLTKEYIEIAAPNILSETQPIRVYLATKKGESVALAYQVIAPDGYSGNIVMMLGIKTDGSILGVRVIAHAETPGLGDKVEEKKDNWILGFDSLSLDNTHKSDWKVKKDGGKFDQFTGATITPRAVVKAVHRGLLFFNNRKTELLNVKHRQQVNK